MTYTVRSGDSLSIVARDVLGDLSRWPELAALNAIAPPYTIYPGQVLQLPADVTTGIPAGGRNVTAAPGSVSQSAWYKQPWVWVAISVALVLFETVSGAGASRPRRRRRRL